MITCRKNNLKQVYIDYIYRKIHKKAELLLICILIEIVITSSLIAFFKLNLQNPESPTSPAPKRSIVVG
jgi:hypothetical protein